MALPCRFLLVLASCAAPVAKDRQPGVTDSGTSSGASVGSVGGTVTGVPSGTPTTSTSWAGSTVLVGDSLGVRTALPIVESDCQTLMDAPCGDVDLDGLTDAWEDLALDLLRPAIRFDEAEPLVDDATTVLADVGRVAPADDGSGAIRVFVMVGYHVDYGRCGLSGHNGDSERVAIDLEPVGPGDADALGFYTAAHEGTITDAGHVFVDAELAELSFPVDPATGDPRWMIFSSDGKHASYGSVDRCETTLWGPCVEEDCEADGVDPLAFTQVPPVWNAGEEAAPRLTDLAAVGFPGEEAWVDQDFCGGLGGSGCAAPVREKLLVDPF